MNLANVAMLEDAATGLGPLLEEVVFVGGATVELWVTDEAAPEFRPTEDVDVIVEVSTQAGASILGFENRWQKEAFPNAVPRTLPSGAAIAAVPPPYLVATKLEAFSSRGKGDLYGSRDFEDVVALVDGREEIVGELAAAPAEVRGYVSGQLRGLARKEHFDAAVEGALRGGSETRERFELVLKPRIEEISKLEG